MLDFLTHHVEEIVIAVLVILGAISYLCRKGNVQKLLVWVCLEAERKYGSKTGQIKLRYAYDWFVSKWPILSALISFEQFGKMVDIALEEMEHLIKTNMNIYKYVNGEDVDPKKIE